jgi:hypothetical protein
VEPDAIYFQELTGGGIVVFSVLGQVAVHQSRYRQSSYGGGYSHHIRMCLGDRTAFMGKGSW